jgi:hypothetical protein
LILNFEIVIAIEMEYAIFALSQGVLQITS